MRFSMILEMVDRLSGPARRARAGARGLGDNIRQMGQRIRRAVSDVRSGERSLEHFARRARRLRQVALGRIFQAIGATVRGLTRNLGSLIARLRLVERAGRAAGAGLRKLGGMGLDFLKNGLAGAGAAVVGAGAFAMFDLFRTAGQFEQYQASLEGTEGSVQAAKNSMAWVQKFARETPYELDQVMESFVQLRNFGLDPMDGSLAALGDASAAISKPLSSAVEMLADATQGEFERLKEFGIKARKEGNRTVFSFVKDGKDIQRSVAGTGVVIQEALVDIFKERFGGGMVRQSKTLFGIISNIKAAWSEFLLMVAEAGIFDFVKQRLQGLLDKVNAMAANGELQRWAQEISDRMTKAWEWGEKFINIDWDRVLQDLRDIAEALGEVADLILSIKRLNDASAAWTPKGAYNALREAADPKLPIPTGDEIPLGAERLRATGVRLPSFKPQSSVEVGGKTVVEIIAPKGFSARPTSVTSNNWSVPMEVRTGRYLRNSG